jgi:hypothetical protein
MNLNFTWSDLELNRIVYKDDPKFFSALYPWVYALIRGASCRNMAPSGPRVTVPDFASNSHLKGPLAVYLYSFLSHNDSTPM